MNDFKNAYQSAVEDMDKLGMKECHIDASLCMDEGRHRRRMMKRMRRTVTTTFSAMCVIFVCGFGTVKAAEYIENVIKVHEWGFETADAVTMALNEEQGNQIYALVESVETPIVDEMEAAQSVEEETVAEPAQPREQEMEEQVLAESETMNGQATTEGIAEEHQPTITDVEQVPNDSENIENAASTEEMSMQEGQSVTEQQVMASAGSEQDVWVKQGEAEVVATFPDLTQKAEKHATAETQTQKDLVEDIPMKNYVSWEEFEANEKIAFATPSISIGKKITATDISVCGDWAMVRYDVDDKVLWLERTDYANTKGHASSKVFPGGVCNERTYTTPTGYTYTLIDSVRESENEPLQIHAAITVGSYEAFVDFSGYTEEDAKKIIDSIDLSIYE